MINPETQLKLQAYLDGELPEQEARDVSIWLDREPEAQALCAELKGIKELMSGNELPLKLPESREFYWSKIERAIHQTSTAAQSPARSAPRFPWWLRVFASAGSFACLCILAVSLLWFSRQPSSLSYLHEIDAPLADTSTISFRSESAGVTVVWVQTHSK